MWGRMPIKTPHDSAYGSEYYHYDGRMLTEYEILYNVLPDTEWEVLDLDQEYGGELGRTYRWVQRHSGHWLAMSYDMARRQGIDTNAAWSEVTRW